MGSACLLPLSRVWQCSGGTPGCQACGHPKPIWLLIGPAMGAGVPFAEMDDWQDSERVSQGKLRLLILWQELGAGSSNLPVAGEGPVCFP